MRQISHIRGPPDRQLRMPRRIPSEHRQYHGEIHYKKKQITTSETSTKDKMRFSTILPVVTVALGAANAAAIDDDVVEPRASQGTKLIKFIGVTKSPKIVFTGVGVPGNCQRLPDSINTFNDVKSVLTCFECEVFTGKDCTGDTFTVSAESLRKGKKTPKWRSWRCDCLE